MLNNQDNFIENFITKEKVFSHNKYQLQIKDLELNIQRIQQELLSKNDEIDLFKNNLTSLQLKNQELNNLNLQLSNNYENHDIKLSEINDLNQILVENNFNSSSNINTTIEQLSNENNTFLITISQLQSDTNILSQKYDDLKQKYQSTLNIVEDKISYINLLNISNKNINNKINLYEELILTKDKEIDILKKSVLKTDNDNSELKTIIFEKDSHLRQLVQNNYSRPINNVGMRKLEINENLDIDSKELKSIPTIEHKLSIRSINNLSLQKNKKGI